MSEPEFASSDLREVPTLTRRAGRGFLWAALTFVVVRLLSFLTLLVVARILAPSEFGAVAAVMTLFLFLQVILDLGVPAALVYEQQEGVTERVYVAFTLNLVVAGVLTVTLLFTAPLIASFFGLASKVGLFRLLAGLVLIRGLAQVPDALFQRDLRFRARIAIDGARAGTRLVVAVSLALAGLGAASLVIGLLVAEGVGVVVSWSLLRFRPRFAWNSSVARELARYGFAITGMILVGAAVANADYLVVGNRLGSGLLSFYYMGFRIPELLILSAYETFALVAFPAFSKARVRGPGTLQRGMLRSLRLLTLFGLPAGLLLAVASRDVVHVVLGNGWGPAVAPMTWIAVGSAFVAVGYASGDLFAAIGRPALLLRLNLVFLVVDVTALVVVAPRGIAAVAVVQAIGALIYGIVRLAVVSRLLELPLSASFHAMRPAIAAAVGVVAAALPLRLLMPAGPEALVAIGLAGLTGALVAVAVLARGTYGEVRRLGLEVLAP